MIEIKFYIIKNGFLIRNDCLQQIERFLCSNNQFNTNKEIVK